MQSETAQEFTERLLAFGEHALQATGELQPMFVAEMPDGKELAIAAVIHQANKAEVLRGISDLMKREKVQRYGFVMESWFVEYGDNEEPSPVRPSKSERRREALTASVCTKEGVEAFIMQEIDRDKDGKPSLGKVLNTSKAHETIDPRTGGSFSELLL